jgi:hypothetical protein
VLREFHEFVTDVNVKKIGPHVWLAIAILVLECLLCYRREIAQHAMHRKCVF